MRNFGSLVVLVLLGSGCVAAGCGDGDDTRANVPSRSGNSGSANAGTGGDSAQQGGATDVGAGSTPTDDTAGAAGTPNHDSSAAGDAGALSNAGSAGSSPDADGTPCAGYTLFSTLDAQSAFSETQLIDMDGVVVHRWNIGGFPPKLLPGGDLIGATGVTPTSYDMVNLMQVSWSGEARWSFSNWAEVGGAWSARQHHDLQREGNPVGYYAPGLNFVTGGSTLVLGLDRRTVPSIRDGEIDDDVIYELDGAGALKQTVWRAADHIAEFGFDEAALGDIRTRSPGTVLEWLHGNSISLVGPNHFFDEGHTEFDPQNIVYSSRNANFVVIISRETGSVVWRIGPDFAGRPEEKLGQFAGQHNPHLIPRGLPGAGNLLVFDDGGASGYGGPSDSDRYFRNYSRVLEFDPVTLDIVWEYGSPTGANEFLSPILSNAQRLPNGNTLITIGTLGKVIEVTPEHEVVWQYEYVPSTPAVAWLYRSNRVPPEWLPAGENAAHGNYPTWASRFERAPSP